MAEKNAKEFLEALNEGAEILAYMEEYQLPEGKDKEDGLVEVAAHFGYGFSKEDLLSEIERLAGVTAAASDAASAAVKGMPAEEMDKVAGGYELEDTTPSCKSKGMCVGVPKFRQKNCKDTYVRGENCWYNDACDAALRWYGGNYCHASMRFL